MTNEEIDLHIQKILNKVGELIHSPSTAHIIQNLLRQTYLKGRIDGINYIIINHVIL